MKKYIKEFLIFGYKQAQASIFAGSFLVVLILSQFVTFPLHRYDCIFLAAILIQVALIYSGLETKDEAKTILLFHILGLILEIYKTSPSVGSWSYPEAGFFKIANVPLYSGFMYAAIRSYIASAWKIFRLRFENYPSELYVVILCALIYINFFTNHFVTDMRYVLFAFVFFLFYRTKVFFVADKREWSMPLILGFALIAFFVWIVENIGTITGAWLYPHQAHVWHAVQLQKITSWTLMVIISFMIVATLKMYKERRG